MNAVKLLQTAAVAVLLLAASQIARADPCVVDTLIGAANPGNSGQGTEETLLEGFVGENVTFDVRFEKGGAGFNITQCAGDPNRFYVTVAPADPGYFVLKFGDGGTNAVNDTFFFQNVADLTELVFTSSQVECLVGGPGCPTNTNTGRLSHYSLYDGSNISVPEPSGLALLGIGMCALFAGLRRKQ